MIQSYMSLIVLFVVVIQFLSCRDMAAGYFAIKTVPFVSLYTLPFTAEGVGVL